MHVVVGGSTGFLGKNLIEALRGRGHTTTALTQESRPRTPSRSGTPRPADSTRR